MERKASFRLERLLPCADLLLFEPRQSVWGLQTGAEL